jgi:hypothetical protein
MHFLTYSLHILVLNYRSSISLPATSTMPETSSVHRPSDVKLKLTDPGHLPTPFNRITVENSHGRSIDIVLRRTVRVPDNKTSHNLPPDLGCFPIFSVQQYGDKLPRGSLLKEELHH